jgi:hypothetical protein
MVLLIGIGQGERLKSPGRCCKIHVLLVVYHRPMSVAIPLRSCTLLYSIHTKLRYECETMEA